jgi:iron(III) transport system substrate-binding protein
LGDFPNAKRIVAPYDQVARDQPQAVPFHTGYFILLINTDLVPATNEPKSWKDLLNPRWKGKILSDAMSPSGGGNVWFHVTYLKFGREFHDQLVKQELTFSRDSIANERRVETGEFAMYIPFNYYRVPELQGPVKAIVPEEGAPYTLQTVSKLTQAPHPNAARAFINYLLSPDAQKIIVDARQGSVTGDGSSTITVLGRRETPRTLELQQEAMKIYGQ